MVLMVPDQSLTSSDGDVTRRVLHQVVQKGKTKMNSCGGIRLMTSRRDSIPLSGRNGASLGCLAFPLRPARPENDSPPSERMPLYGDMITRGRPMTRLDGLDVSTVAITFFRD